MSGCRVEGGTQDAGLPWEMARAFLTLTTGLPVILAHGVTAYLAATVSAKDSVLPVEHEPPSGK